MSLHACPGVPRWCGRSALPIWGMGCNRTGEAASALLSKVTAFDVGLGGALACDLGKSPFACGLALCGFRTVRAVSSII